eukprot:3236724-Prymnesium_polylepis.1
MVVTRSAPDPALLPAPSAHHLPLVTRSLLRSSSVSSTAGHPAVSSHGAPTTAARRYRQLFGLGKEEGLMLRTTCSMRKEANALKDANVQFGDLYVFEAHLCFDWK